MFGVAALLCTVLWFALLAQRPLFDPDEGRYAEIPREMLLSGGDWVIPHLNGIVYLEKPPLQYWLTALAFRAFGQNEFAARLCTGAAGYLSLAAVFLLGRKLWGFAAGVRAALFSAASALFVLLGHQLTLDMLLSFWLTAALGCFLMAQARREDSGQRRRLWMLGCWAAMALALLTKGLIGVLIPAATLGAYVSWQRDWQLLGRLNLRWGVPLFAAIAAPWFVLAARANGQFLEFFFVREHFLRFLTPIEHRTEPWWFFAPVLIVGIMPWLPQAVRALAATPTDRVRRGEFDTLRLLWVWCVFVLVFFSLSDSKLIPYVLPAVPPLALLCAGRRAGGGAGESGRGPGDSPGESETRGGLLAGSLLTLASCAGLMGYVCGLWGSADARELLPLIRPVLYWTCTLLALGALTCVLCAQKGRPLAALAGLCGSWFLASGTILVAAIPAQSQFSAKDLALALRSQAAADTSGRLPTEVPIFAVQAYEQSLPFYLRRTVVLVDYRDEFDLGLTQSPRLGIATLGEFADVWRPLDGGFAVMPPRTWVRLSALGLPMREIARVQDRVIVSRR
jgi:4-amino-4-deoxy-L-arabinose transferase-like glycosyltransferase